MYLSDLRLTNFRNYASCELQLPPGPVVFLGRNGQGKTNLVEGAAYLSSLSSHRVTNDAPLVREGEAAALVSGRVVRDARSIALQVEIVPGRANRAWLNRSPVRRAREILGYARVVTFAPEDLALVRGDPDRRRRYLDDLLVLRSPRMAAVRADYDKALRQRNALLRTAGEGRGYGSAEPAGLREWDEALASLGGQLAAARCALVDQLATRVDQTYATVAPDSGVARIRYQPSSRLSGERSSGGPTGGPPGGAEAFDPASWCEVLLAALRGHRREELARGVTVVGPHRDDLEIELSGRSAKGYASHGEGWSLALALRLASYGLLTDDWADTPVLVLDDVFAELDAGRRARLAHLALEAEQVLVTAAVAADVPDALRGVRCDVESGSVTSTGSLATGPSGENQP